jgi:DNA-binding NarL/FixJ family response regulator
MTSEEVGLTPKQITVLKLAWQGHGTKETAALMRLSYATVKNYRHDIFMKLGVRNVEGMLREGVHLGYLDARKPEQEERPNVLLPREEMVLQMLWQGMAYRQIALALNISLKMVSHVRVQLGRKLGAMNGIQVVRRALEKGLIQV